MADTPSQSQSTGALEVLAASDLAKTGSSSAKIPAITNQAVLDDMQKLYEQKLAERNYFMQDLADAQAWWSGGAAGPSAGLVGWVYCEAGGEVMSEERELYELRYQVECMVPIMERIATALEPRN